MNHRPLSVLVISLLGLGGVLGATASHAQYKVIDANGRVTYTDRPNTAGAAKVEAMRPSDGGVPSSAAALAGLPFELRQVAERYPVTLYTSESCEPCDAGRSLLRQRGVPYTEKTVRSDADRNVFQQLEASGELPVLRIGVQQLRRYNPGEWSSYLDAAGYPRQSRLPSGYKQAEASSLVPEQPAGPKAPPVDAPPQPPAALPPALENAPSGIRF